MISATSLINNKDAFGRPGPMLDTSSRRWVHRWVGAGGRADMLCSGFQLKESRGSIWPAGCDPLQPRGRASRPVVVSYPHQLTPGETYRQKGNSGIVVHEGLAWR
eukprot:scaffold176_cov166-Isochrysis_galbana.AAC.1